MPHKDWDIQNSREILAKMVILLITIMLFLVAVLIAIQSFGLKPDSGIQWLLLTFLVAILVSHLIQARSRRDSLSSVATMILMLITLLAIAVVVVS